MALYNSKSQSVLFLKFLKLTIFVFVPFPFANSISFKYFDFQPNDPKILYQGDASAANGKIELTNAIDTANSSTRVGRASYADPVHLWDSKSGNMTDFYCFFSYNITSTNNTHLGDGFTFFLSPYNASIPIDPVGGLLGLFNSTVVGQTNNQIVAVEFDTKQDSWDPCPYHIGVDVGSIKSVSYIPLDDRLANGTAGAGWVIYDSTTKTLSVWQSYDGGQTFNKLFYDIDLRNVLPEWVSVGFSAGLATSSTERHTINIWTFNSSYSILEDSSNSASGPSPSNSTSNSASGPSPSNSTSNSMITGHKTKSRLGVSLSVGIIGPLILVALFCFIKWKRRNHGTNANARVGANGEIIVGPNATVVGTRNQLGCVNSIPEGMNADTRGGAIGTTKTGGIDMKGSGTLSVGSTTIIKKAYFS